MERLMNIVKCKETTLICSLFCGIEKRYRTFCSPVSVIMNNKHNKRIVICKRIVFVQFHLPFGQAYKIENRQLRHSRELPVA